MLKKTCMRLNSLLGEQQQQPPPHQKTMLSYRFEYGNKKIKFS